MVEDAHDDPGKDKGGAGEGKITVNGKEYSEADVNNLVTNAQATAQKAERLTKVDNFMKAMGFDEVDEFLGQIEGGFSTLGNLLQKGVIDNEGNVLKKKDDPPATDDDKPDINKIFNLRSDQSDVDINKLDGPSKAILQAITKINDRISGVEKRLSESDSIQSSIIQNRYERDIMSAYNNLDREDAAKVLGEALALKNAGRKFDIMELAKRKSESKAANVEQINRNFAKEHDLDYDTLVKTKETNPNELDEPGGGMPASLIGKKFSFNKTGDDYVKPGDALKEFLKEKNSK